MKQTLKVIQFTGRSNGVIEKFFQPWGDLGWGFQQILYSDATGDSTVKGCQLFMTFDGEKDMVPPEPTTNSVKL
ncbi:MAG: hypothetical protein Q7K11_01285 [Candidatus Berkelbacteria bacterium]|nr:hypothetical protein [Candidatus Berkelbacteria bacterium]